MEGKIMIKIKFTRINFSPVISNKTINFIKSLQKQITVFYKNFTLKKIFNVQFILENLNLV